MAGREAASAAAGEVMASLAKSVQVAEGCKDTGAWTESERRDRAWPVCRAERRGGEAGGRRGETPLVRAGGAGLSQRAVTGCFVGRCAVAYERCRAGPVGEAQCDVEGMRQRGAGELRGRAGSRNVQGGGRAGVRESRSRAGPVGEAQCDARGMRQRGIEEQPGPCGQRERAGRGGERACAEGRAGPREPEGG
jgi:hypothetical protein